MWCIWKERNQRTFEDLDRYENQLLALFSGSLFDWARVWGLTSSDSIPLFLSSLLHCIYWLFRFCFFFFFGLFCWCYFASSSFFILFLTYKKKKKKRLTNICKLRILFICLVLRTITLIRKKPLTLKHLNNCMPLLSLLNSSTHIIYLKKRNLGPRIYGYAKWLSSLLSTPSGYTLLARSGYTLLKNFGKLHNSPIVWVVSY